MLHSTLSVELAQARPNILGCFVAPQPPTQHDRALSQLNRSQEARMGSIAPSFGALPSSRSSPLTDEYTELKGLCFLLLLLLLSSVTLSYLTNPLASSYSHSTSVPLMTVRHAPPINDRNWNYKRRRGGGCF